MNVSGVNAFNPATKGDFSRLDIQSTKNERSLPDAETITKVSSESDGVKVSISKEGRDALATNSGSVLHAQSSKSNAQIESAEKSDTPKKKIDELIESLKEKVEELKAQLQQLQNDKSEAGEKKRQALQSQIAVLSAQIMELTDQKLEQEKRENA